MELNKTTIDLNTKIRDNLAAEYQRKAQEFDQMNDISVNKKTDCNKLMKKFNTDCLALNY